MKFFRLIACAFGFHQLKPVDKYTTQSGNQVHKCEICQTHKIEMKGRMYPWGIPHMEAELRLSDKTIELMNKEIWALDEVGRQIERTQLVIDELSAANEVIKALRAANDKLEADIFILKNSVKPKKPTKKSA